MATHTPGSTTLAGEETRITAPLYDFGGHGPVIHLAVANGFPPHTYKPLLDPLASCYHSLSTLPRAMWPAPPPPDTLTSWWQLADDMLDGLRQHQLTGVIAVGHSMGATVSTLAAIADPGRFKALVLLDPTFLPSKFTTLVWFARLVGQSHRMPLARGALRRRSRFTTITEALDYWRAKPLFHDWPADTLRLYAEGITRPSVGGGIELAWSPGWEARYYQTVLIQWRREVARLRSLLPVLAIQGALTNTFSDSSVRAMRRLVPDATYARIEGHGHLFPHTAPDETRRILEEWLGSQQL